MKLISSMVCVNGDYTCYASEEPKAATYIKDWLTKYDHEGSSIDLKIEISNYEEVYKILTLLENDNKETKEIPNN